MSKLFKRANTVSDGGVEPASSIPPANDVLHRLTLNLSGSADVLKQKLNGFFKISSKGKNDAAADESSVVTEYFAGCKPHGDTLSPGWGYITGCPLRPEDYETAWKDRDSYAKMASSSQLYTSLQAFLTDDSAITYLVDYMRKRKVLHYLKFWFEIEKFRASLQSSKDDVSARALQLFTQYVSEESPHRIELPEEAKQALILAISPEDGVVPHTCFDQAQQHCYQAMQTHFFEGFRQSDFYSQFLISVLTSGNVCLQDLLHNESTCMVFMEYMDREASPMLLQFSLSLSNLKHQSDDVAAEQLVEDAHALYHRFIDNNVLKLDAYTLAETASLLQSAPATLDWIVRPEHLVLTALNKYYLPTFLHSEMYFKFLNETINVAVQTAPPSPPTTRSPRPYTIDDTITEADELDAQALGARAKSHDFRTHPSSEEWTFGTVNEWGVYIMYKSVARNAVDDLSLYAGGAGTKLRFNPNRRAEMDMAVQVAQMIIADIYKEMRLHGTLYEARKRAALVSVLRS